jgi:Ca2+-binding EF-hand superfamily protein
VKAKLWADNKDADLVKQSKHLSMGKIKGKRNALMRSAKLWQMRDVDDSGTLALSDVQEVLAQLPLDLSDNEVDAIIERLPKSRNGQVQYKPFLQQSVEIVESAIQETFLEDNATDAELYLRQLFQKVAGDKDSLPLSTLVRIVQEENRLPLTDIHLHAMTSNYKNDAPINFKQFARHTAILVYRLFNIKPTKTQIEKRAGFAPITALTGRSKYISEQQMKSKFREFDSDNDGMLTIPEFHKFIADMNLCMSETSIDTLVKEYFLDTRIKFDEFMEFVNGKLLHLTREAVVRSQFTGQH